jgi:hypothetical protein
VAWKDTRIGLKATATKVSSEVREFFKVLSTRYARHLYWSMLITQEVRENSVYTVHRSLAVHSSSIIKWRNTTILAFQRTKAQHTIHCIVSQYKLPKSIPVFLCHTQQSNLLFILILLNLNAPSCFQILLFYFTRQISHIK